MNAIFDHEKLKVYQDAVEFVAWADGVLAAIPKSSALRNQLDRASISIPLNIAEGNGKWTPRDRCHYFDIARGSALESSAALDVARAKSFLSDELNFEGKKLLSEIVKMLVGLLKANDPDRKFGTTGSVREDAGYYLDQDQD